MFNIPPSKFASMHESKVADFHSHSRQLHQHFDCSHWVKQNSGPAVINTAGNGVIIKEKQEKMYML